MSNDRVIRIDDRYFHRSANDEALMRVALDARRLSGGAEIVARYERALSQRFGMTHALAVSSGGAALHACLEIVGAHDGAKVLVPATAPLPTILPILSAGAEPIFVDTNPRKLAFDERDLYKCLTKGVRAVITVSLWGYPFDLRPYHDLFRDRQIAVIEDASHAHGSLLSGQQVGYDADLACFSTHDCKMLATGEGGFVLGRDSELMTRLERFCRLDHLAGVCHGVNYKLGALQSAIGLARLPDLDRAIEIRTKNARALLSQIGNVPLTELEGAQDAVQNYYALVLVTEKHGTAFARLLSDCGIPTDVSKYGYRVGFEHPLFARWHRSCPNAHIFVENTHPIPVHPAIEPAMLDYMGAQIRRSALTIAS